MKKAVLIPFFLIYTSIIYSQEALSLKGKINNIEFNMSAHSRFPYNKLSITIKKDFRSGDVNAEVVSRPRNKDSKWNYSKIDTMINIPQERYDEICSNLNKIESDSIKSNFNLIGGRTSISIKYGDPQNFVQYGMKSPSSKKEFNFYRSCEIILNLIGLDPQLFLFK